jgi:curved DNA-binding protein CbpA
MSVSQGFYQLLGIDAGARPEDVRAAYQTRLGELVRRMRAARKQGADVTVLEAQERTLREAMQVLSDPVRRRRYDAYRTAMDSDVSLEGDTLWAHARDALVDPAAAVAVQVLARLTTLPVGAPFRHAPSVPARRYGPALADNVMPEFTDPRAPMNPIPGLSVPAAASDLEPLFPSGGGRQSPDHSEESVLHDAGWDMPGESGPPVRPLDEVARLHGRFGSDGRFLKAVREHRGLSLEGVSEATKISVRYLKAIEDNAYDSLPAATFVRGYLREFSRVLALEAPETIVEGYMALFAHHRG